MISVLIFGFLLGMRHALEADHIAAVATLTTQTKSVRQAMLHGAVWGLGHTVTLFIFCGAVLLLNSAITDKAAALLELCVGIMLVILGIDVLRRIIRDKVHFHVHEHDDSSHFHAHSHAENDSHDHDHTNKFPFKALFIGLMHGMAGSAALILLTIESVVEPWIAISYILLFGFGSIIGMAALTIVIVMPLKATANSMTCLHNTLRTVIGVISIAIGGALIYQY